MLIYRLLFKDYYLMQKHLTNQNIICFWLFIGNSVGTANSECIKKKVDARLINIIISFD